MAAAQAPTVYTAQAMEEYINQKFIGNEVLLDQKLEQAANYLGQCVTQLQSTDLKAEHLAAKMMEDEQRIGEVVARATETRDAVRPTHDKVVEMHGEIVNGVVWKGSSPKRNKKDFAVWKLVDKSGNMISGTGSKPSRSTSKPSTGGPSLTKSST